jgi:hypothetical protein
MWQILQPATENLVYHHRLDDDDDLDDIALGLEQYLNTSKRRRLEKLPDHDGLPSFSPDAKAELRTQDGSDSDISSVAPERNICARPGRLFERTESPAVDTTEPRSLSKFLPHLNSDPLSIALPNAVKCLPTTSGIPCRQHEVSCKRSNPNVETPLLVQADGTVDHFLNISAL